MEGVWGAIVFVGLWVGGVDGICGGGDIPWRTGSMPLTPTGFFVVPKTNGRSVLTSFWVFNGDLDVVGFFEMLHDS